MGLIECKHGSTLITNEGNFVCKECGEITTPLTKTEKRILELETENGELKDFVIWMTGCGYDFCQHDYFRKQRDKLLKGG